MAHGDKPPAKKWRDAIDASPFQCQAPPGTCQNRGMPWGNAHWCMEHACGRPCKSRDNRPCPARPLPGRTRCKMHGGESPIGPANPAWKHGKYSVAMQRLGLSDRYQEARNNPRLVSLRDEIASCDVRLVDLHERLAAGSSNATWEQAREAFEALKASAARGDGTAAQAATARLDEVFTAHATLQNGWAEIFAAMEQRRTLSETEARTLIGMRQVLTAEQALGFVRHVIALQAEYLRQVTCPHCQARFTPRAELSAMAAAAMQFAGADAKAPQPLLPS